MRQAILSIRDRMAIGDRMDGLGIVLSGLCALHCLTGLLLVGILGMGSQFLFAPHIHRVGLAVAIAVGFVSIGLGVLRHGRLEPMVLGIVGLSFMGAGLVVEHGLPEAVVTILGVALVALAHIRNLHKPA